MEYRIDHWRYDSLLISCVPFLRTIGSVLRFGGIQGGIAQERKASVPTISPRLVQVLQALAHIFRDLGFNNVDDLKVAE